MKYLAIAMMILAGCVPPKDTKPLAELCVAIGIGLESPLIAPDTPTEVCEDCDGRGWNGDGVTKITCDTCGGTGKPAGDSDTSHTDEPLAGINWMPLSSVRGNGLPTWVHFWQPSCEPCIRLKREAFWQPEVLEATQGLNCVMLEATPEVAAEWGVTETPCDVWVTADNKILGRSTPLSPSKFAFYLTIWKERLEL
jgi:thiol-disulfide isomerase/thioredoxin